ncbi:MAG TPA: VTT domain-containing protein [Gemmatimonadaceae bacterium]|nr:VTT domain-containing protein [Gemmatimonadaceae bacterium]
MLDVITQWVSHYGYLLVALFLFVEGIGLPVPGETALVTAAALAGRGTMSLVGVMIAGAIGTIAGVETGYWLGARGGTAVVTRYGKWIRLTPERLDRTHRFFAQHGAKTVLLGRFVAFVRSFVGIFAGLSAMPIRVFTAYNAIGGSVWVVTFSALGYAFGRNLPRLVRYIGRVSLLLAVLVALVVAVVWLWRWFGRNRVEIIAALNTMLDRMPNSPRVTGMRTRHPRAWRFVGGRFRRGEYLVVHLAIGFLLSLAVIGVFASITEGLVDTSPLTRFDTVVWMHLRRSITTDALHTFSVISSFGGRGAMTLLLVAGALVYAVRRRGVELAAWCAAFIGGSLLDASLRFVVRRSELPFADIVLINWGTGLASGHALGVIVGYGMLAYLVSSLTRRALARTAAIVIATAIIAAITISRLYLGQHYVSDASAGLAAGLIWLTACISGSEIARSTAVAER